MARWYCVRFPCHPLLFIKYLLIGGVDVCPPHAQTVSTSLMSRLVKTRIVAILVILILFFVNVDYLPLNTSQFYEFVIRTTDLVEILKRWLRRPLTCAKLLRNFFSFSFFSFYLFKQIHILIRHVLDVVDYIIGVCDSGD